MSNIIVHSTSDSTSMGITTSIGSTLDPQIHGADTVDGTAITIIIVIAGKYQCTDRCCIQWRHYTIGPGHFHKTHPSHVQVFVHYKNDQCQCFVRWYPLTVSYWRFHVDLSFICSHCYHPLLLGGTLPSPMDAIPYSFTHDVCVLLDATKVSQNEGQHTCTTSVCG